MDYKKSKIQDVNKYFEFKLAKSLGINTKVFQLAHLKSSNLFGRFKNNFNKF